MIIKVYGVNVELSPQEKAQVDQHVQNEMTKAKCPSCVCIDGVHDDSCVGPELSCIKAMDNVPKIASTKKKQLSKLPKTCRCRECPKTGDTIYCDPCATKINWQEDYMDDCASIAVNYYSATWFKRAE